MTKLPAKIEEKATHYTGAATTNYARLVNLFGYGATGSDAPMSVDEALKLSAIQICLDVISQDISKVELQLREKLPNGGSRVVDHSEHWLARMLALDPNKHHNWMEFIEMMVLHLGTVQNAFIAKKFNRNGQVEALIPLMPAHVRILVDEDAGRYVYDIERYTPHEKLMLRDFERYLLEDEVIHIRGRMFDGLFGYSNLEAGSAGMALAKAVQGFQTRLFKNDATVNGVFQLKNDETLSEESYNRLKKQLRELWRSNKEHGEPMVLEEGLEFKSISMNSDSAEVSKARQSSLEDASRLLRVPPHKVMNILNVKYENMETLEKSYVQDTLIPIAGRVEKKLSGSLLTEDERLRFYLEFNRESMVLTDVEKQAEMMRVMVGLAGMEIDEMRMRRGLNPLPDDHGQVRLIPPGYSVVDRKGEVVIQAGGTSEDGAVDVDEDGDKNTDDKGFKTPEVKPFPRIVQ